MALQSTRPRIGAADPVDVPDFRHPRREAGRELPALFREIGIADPGSMRM